MNHIKKVLSILIISSTAMLLVSCSSNSKIDQLSSENQTLNTKVDQISSDIGTLRSDIKIAKDDAARANQRLDNQATSYHK